MPPRLIVGDTFLVGRFAASSIPQADSPQLILRVLNLIASGTPPTPAMLGIHKRQVLYYRRAAQILGLLDGQERPTPRAEFLLLRPTEDRLQALGVVFAASSLGRAIIDMGQGGCIHDVDPRILDAFLAQHTALTGKTVGRRATTLRKWVREFQQAMAHANGSCGAMTLKQRPDVPTRTTPSTDRVRESRRMSLREQTLAAASLAAARDELLFALVDVAVLRIVAHSRSRKDARPLTATAAELDLETMSIARATTSDPHRERILVRKGRHAARRLGLLGRDIRQLANDEGIDANGALRREKELAARLAAANQGLVGAALRRFSTVHLSPEDLMQEGCMGLLRAIDKFDVRRGTTFATYATHWIRQAITRAIGDQESMVRVPIHLQELLRKVGKARQVFEVEHGRPGLPKEIAVIVDAPLLAVAKVMKRLDDHSGSTLLILDESVDDRGPARDLFSAEGPSPLENALDAEEFAAVHAVVEGIENDRERTIIKMRFGIGHPREHTLEELGTQFGVTRERIRQIEVKVMRKLKKRARVDGLAEFLDNPDQPRTATAMDEIPPAPDPESESE